MLATGWETEMSVCWRRGVGVIIWIRSCIISAALNRSVILINSKPYVQTAFQGDVGRKVIF